MLVWHRRFILWTTALRFSYNSQWVLTGQTRSHEIFAQETISFSVFLQDQTCTQRHEHDGGYSDSIDKRLSEQYVFRKTYGSDAHESRTCCSFCRVQKSCKWTVLETVFYFQRGVSERPPDTGFDRGGLERAHKNISISKGYEGIKLKLLIIA